VRSEIDQTNQNNIVLGDQNKYRSVGQILIKLLELKKAPWTWTIKANKKAQIN